MSDIPRQFEWLLIILAADEHFCPFRVFEILITIMELISAAINFFPWPDGQIEDSHLVDNQIIYKIYIDHFLIDGHLRV